MGFENWKRFASSGKKGNGLQRVQQGKKNKASSSRSGKKEKAKKKNKKTQGGSSSSEVKFDEAKWRAESDADALMRAKEILEDRSRLKLARSVAEEKAKVAREAADSIKQL